MLSFSTPGWGINDSKSDTGDRERPAASERGRAVAERTRVPGMTPASGSASKVMDRDFITYLDKKGIDGFVEWNSFTHPEFGEVEIGGFKPYEINNPPASEIARLGEAHGEFAVWLSGLYANIKIAETEVINHGGGLFRIKAEIENSGFLPTSLSQGVTSRSVKPTMVQLEVEPEAIISGSSKTSFIQALDGSGNRQKYEWLIKGKAGDKIDLKVVAQKAGTDRVSITLK